VHSKSYVILWDEVFDNGTHIEAELQFGGFDYLVINRSSVTVPFPNWIRGREGRYYSHFFTALEDFVKTDADIFILNAGDSRWQDIAGYTARIMGFFKKDPDIGIFAPTQTNDPFSGHGSFLAHSTKHPGLDLSAHTNGIFTAMTRDIAEFMLEYYYASGIDFDTMTSGWGLDSAYCALAIYKNKKIYRDAAVTMFHPTGSHYDYARATDEAFLVMRTFKEFCATKGLDSDVIQQIYDMSIQKVHRRESYNLTIEELYLNLKDPLDV
jgi:hypothetical protein